MLWYVHIKYYEVLYAWKGMSKKTVLTTSLDRMYLSNKIINKAMQSSFFVEALVKIFIDFIDNGSIPSSLKISRTSSKKGNVHSPNDTPPIAIQCIILKILVNVCLSN